MRKRLIYVSIAVVLLLVISGYTGYTALFTPNIQDSETIVTILKTDTQETAIEKIVKSGILKCNRTFKWVARWKLDRISSGCYRFNLNSDNRFIVNSIRLGWQSPCRITLSGKIRSISRISVLLSNQLQADSAEIDRAFRAHAEGKDELTVLSRIIPETYEVYWTISPEELIDRFEKEYGRFWNENRRKQAGKMGMTPEEISILASIVGEESNVEEELPDIAGVYVNRLKRGMPLQADPTVKFAAKDPTIKRILLKHLEIDSPYNTYKHPGLPPGPIVVPSSIEIDAVLNYHDHDFLYFCADPSFNGTHRFAKTLSQHNRNAAEYHQALRRMKIN